MWVTIHLRGLEADNGQSDLCKKSLYASDADFNGWRRRLKVHGPHLSLYTPEVPKYFHSRIDLPQFGNIWVMAELRPEDNGTKPFDFIRLAQDTYLRHYKRFDQRAVSKASPKTLAHLSQAIDYQQLAFERKQRGDADELVNYDDLLALTHAIIAAEDRLLETSAERLQKKQRTDILLGCNTHQFDLSNAWNHRFRNLFNYATLPFYTGRVLRSEKDKAGGHVRFSRNTDDIDRTLEWCLHHGIQTKGHPLFFGHEGTNPPEFLALKWPELLEQTLLHAEISVKQYKSRIQYWDAINEAHDWANCFNLTQEQNIEIARLVCARVRDTDPKAGLIINNSLIFGEYVADHEVCYGPLFNTLKTPMQYLKDLISDNTDFDIIGLQLYFPARDMVAIDCILDRYEKLGKLLHITELGVPAGTDRGETYPMASRDVHPQIGLTRGQWRTAWNESVQADWLERFYVQMMARESVKAVSWWDMQDPGFMKTSPFLLQDGSPRSIYYRLNELRQTYIGPSFLAGRSEKLKGQDSD